jgi:hypothetical protein
MNVQFVKGIRRKRLSDENICVWSCMPNGLYTAQALHDYVQKASFSTVIWHPVRTAYAEIPQRVNLS